MVHINSGKKMQAHTQIVEIDIHPIISQHSETADAADRGKLHKCKIITQANTN